MIGDRFGRLVVESVTGGRHTVAVCRCDCGTTKAIRASVLRAGQAKSCGCFRSERIAKMNHRHGETTRNTTSAEWRTWRSMRQRCEDPKATGYASYGGRGIKVCERWRASFAAFLEDVGRRPSPDHSIDRIDNGRGYEPGNVRWATRSEQAKNRRERPRNADGTYAGATQ